MTNMNGTEKIAYNNIVAGFEYIVGEWYNDIMDNCIEYIPDTEKEAKQFIYDEVLINKYGQGYCGSHKAPKEMRFAGKEFIMSVIDKLFETDGDAAEIREEKNW